MLIFGRHRWHSLLFLLFSGFATVSATAQTSHVANETRYANGASIEPRWRTAVATMVTIKSPLPSEVGPRPAACDEINYLRYRHKKGPRDSKHAASVVVLMPGIFEGAGAMDALAQNIVWRAAQKNRQYVEVWAIDRRSNCLEDLTGISSARASGNSKQAFDYYLNNEPIDGKIFKGWDVTPEEKRVLDSLGLKQTLEDYRTVITSRFPSTKVQQQKIVCGGHSLGGRLIGLFSSWDFDGNPETTDDAGHNHCGGYLALDTKIENGAQNVGRTSSGLSTSQLFASPALVRDGYITMPVINPQVTTLLGIAGALAAHSPQVESTVFRSFDLNKTRERFPLFSVSIPLLMSKDIGHFLQGGLDPTTIRFTNQALLGALLDDNFFNMSTIAQVSAGFASGGPIEDKNFPLPNDLSKIPGLRALSKNLLGGGNLAIPALDQPNNFADRPIYKWSNYNEVETNKWTSPRNENTNINSLARSLASVPLDFTEKYFPSRLSTESAAAGAGDRATGDLRHIVYERGPFEHPAITFFGEDGTQIIFNDEGANIGTKVVLPGYSHVDPLTAAPIQHDGSLESTMESTVDFINKHFTTKK